MPGNPACEWLRATTVVPGSDRAASFARDVAATRQSLSKMAKRLEYAEAPGDKRPLAESVAELQLGPPTMIASPARIAV
jgi:hypothetical protein